MNLLEQVQQLQQVNARLIELTKQLFDENQSLKDGQATQSQLSQSEVTTLKEQLDLSQQHQLHQEEQWNVLKIRHDALVLAHESMRTDFERLSQDLTQMRQQQHVLQQERDHLAKKNEYAKAKVEAIMQRLAALSSPVAGADTAQNSQQASLLPE